MRCVAINRGFHMLEIEIALDEHTYLKIILIFCFASSGFQMQFLHFSHSVIFLGTPTFCPLDICQHRSSWWFFNFKPHDLAQQSKLFSIRCIKIDSATPSADYVDVELVRSIINFANTCLLVAKIFLRTGFLGSCSHLVVKLNLSTSILNTIISQWDFISKSLFGRNNLQRFETEIFTELFLPQWVHRHQRWGWVDHWSLQAWILLCWSCLGHPYIPKVVLFRLCNKQH